MQRRRRLLLTAACALLGSAASIEAVSWAVAAMRLGTLAPGQAIRRRLAASRREPLPRPDLRRTDKRLFGGAHILHPYLGFVNEPAAHPGTNRFGFLGPVPLVKRGADRVNVLLIGGSVAQELFTHAGRLTQALGQVPRFAGKQIVLIPACLGGYKQPQGLLALSYLLALGSEFDLLLNLDGFNEATLPLAENLRRGVEPSFPRSWDLFARKGLRLDQVLLIGRQSLLNERREAWRDLFALAPLRYSMSALGLWDAQDRSLEADGQALQAELADSLATDQDGGEQVRGAGLGGAGRQAVLASSVALWGRASWQLHALSQANGIHYHHFLQPNQYDPAGKRLTEEESRLVAGGDPFTLAAKEAVEGGYPAMRAEGARLARRGVRFTDLTGIFKAERGTIYRDPCCHFNGRGYDLLAQAMARAVVDGLGPSGAPRRAAP